MSEIKWWKIQNQNLAVAARRAGFDLAIYDKYRDSTKSELRKRTIQEALRELDEAFLWKTNKNLSDIKKGVYVICVSSPFTIKYEAGSSEIIYIGQGAVRSRIEKHFENSLFDFMLSLSGANFDFYVTEPKRKGPGPSTEYYKHIEFELLREFSEKIGGGPKQYPLLNKNSGANKSLLPGKGWNSPLKRTGKKPRWQLCPTSFWDIEKLN